MPLYNAWRQLFVLPLISYPCPLTPPDSAAYLWPVPLYASIGYEYHIHLNYLIWLNIEKRSLMHATANSVENFSK